MNEMISSSKTALNSVPQYWWFRAA